MSNYEKNTFSNYYISRSKPHHDPIYKYKTLTYNCKRGGRIFKSSSTGLREKRTFKQGCNSKICVRKILYDNEIPKISQNLPTIAASSCIAETINTGDSFPIAETNILVNTGDSSPIAETSQILVNTGDSSPIAETSQILDNTGDSFPIAETSQILEVISDSSCIPRISNFSQANQNMTETINLPASNTENTQLCGTQVKIPESPQSKTIPATFEFSSSQNISKNILGTQIKLPNRNKYNLIELPENNTI
ncbi:cell division cycle-associated protein 3-like isoform X13 [Gordionus sp. m RMFG-2023]|uniref:cell division cycle-associated protein 3-like isoform X13 n=1 Tax=Gordionus sp. m RMFG-2023 TaxID=3053472 RepID=UPI0031FCBD7A